MTITCIDTKVLEGLKGAIYGECESEFNKALAEVKKAGKEITEEMIRGCLLKNFLGGESYKASALYKLMGGRA